MMRRILLITALSWLLAASLASVRSQNNLNYRVQQVEERTGKLETSGNENKILVESRLTKLETQLETVTWLLKGVAGAIGLHLISSVAGLVMRRANNNGD